MQKKIVQVDLPAGVIKVDGIPVGQVLSTTIPGSTKVVLSIVTDRVFDVLQYAAEMDVLTPAILE